MPICSSGRICVSIGSVVNLVIDFSSQRILIINCCVACSLNSTVRTTSSRPMDGFVDRPLLAAQEHKFQSLLLELTVGLALPFQWIEREEVQSVIRFLRPAAVRSMPSRKQLAGPLLDARTILAKEDMMKGVGR